MRQYCLLGLFALVLGGGLLGCSKKAPPQVVVPVDPAPAVATTPQQNTPATSQPGNPTDTQFATQREQAAPATTTSFDLPVAPPELSPEEKYNAALLEALGQMSDRKYAEALVTLQTAQQIQDSEAVRTQIDKVKTLIEQQAAVEKTVQDIQTVLQAGRAEEASLLATVSLKQYGDTEAADRFLKLKQEADALLATQSDDTTARRQRFRQEGDDAIKDRNLRAAVAAYEQSLQLAEDADLRARVEEIRGTLARYDSFRQRAAEQRRDSGQLEEALVSLNEAAKLWDTVQVRQEIDECNLALQRRRDRLTVADFEVRDDIGIPHAGQALADELLPRFKAPFDLVERSQLNKVLVELRVEAADLAVNESGRQEFGRLANVRYLVVGSVHRLAGITVHARLVDVRSGLVVQTAKLVVATPEELVPRLPQVANMLMMNDEQKLAYETKLVQQTPVPVKPVQPQAIPAPPEILPVAQPLPTAIIPYSPRPPDFGGLRLTEITNIALVGNQSSFALGVSLQREDPVKARLLSVAVELGDNLFRRRRYAEAQTQFQLALSLAPGNRDIAIRIDRCQPLLPPPVVIQPVVVAPPVVVVRPRIAVLNFMVTAPLGLMPPGYGDWISEQIGAYYWPAYEVVDRGELYWYMGRLGLTVRDVAVNPIARLWLARALNVRYFVFGVVEHTASFNVSAHLVDAESGYRQGMGMIHVQDRLELKLRLRELVHQTTLNPAEQARLQQQARLHERQLNEVRRLVVAGQSAQAIQAARVGLVQSPNDVALLTLLNQAEQQQRARAIEDARKQELARIQAQIAAEKKRQADLIAAAEAARRKAELEAAARTEAVRRQEEVRKQRAADMLQTQALAAMQKKDYPKAIQLLESANSLKPSETLNRELALARAEVARLAQMKAAEEKARLEAEARQKREAELARVRAQVEQERTKRLADELARRKAQETRDHAQAAKLFDEGKALLAKEKYDEAVAAFQGSLQLHKTPETQALIKQAGERQALADAKQKGMAAQKELERKLAEEKAQRDKAEADARQKRQLYTQTIEAAQKALANKQYDEAIAKFQEAGKSFRTDAVLNGIKIAEEAKARDQEAIKVARQKKLEEEAMATRVQQLLNQGQAAVAAKQFDNAVRFFTEATKLAPTNQDAVKGLTAAEQGRMAARNDAERTKKLDAEMKLRGEFARLRQAAQKAVQEKRYEEAVRSYAEAQKLQPDAPGLKEEVAAAQRLLELSIKPAPITTTPQPNSSVPPTTQPMPPASTQPKGGPPTTTPTQPATQPKGGPPSGTTTMPPSTTQPKGPPPSTTTTPPSTTQPKGPPPSTTTTPPSTTQPKGGPPSTTTTPPSTTQPKGGPPPTTTSPPSTTQPKGGPPTAQPKGGTPTKAPAVTPQVRSAFLKQIQQASALEKQQKFAEAAAAYGEALKLIPEDTSAKIGQGLAKGQAALKNKQFKDAAQEFEDVLKLSPKHAEATRLLRQAQQGK